MKILVTGGTGFLGKPLIKRLIDCHDPYMEIRVLARNEGKLIELKQELPNIEIMTGDIGDKFTARRSVQGIDHIYHLAAFKHVGLAEDQAYECTKSNLIGTLNLLHYFEGSQFLAISTDKAAQVAGVYGGTKMIMERLIHSFAKINTDIKYRIVRYGNVLYSTGSVLCKWKKLLEEGGEVTITDGSATRFFWTVSQALDLIEECLHYAKDSQPYCPEMKSMSIDNLLEAMQQKYGRASKINKIGLQPGENLHEKIMEDGPDSSESEQYTIEEIKNLI